MKREGVGSGAGRECDIASSHPSVLPGVLIPTDERLGKRIREMSRSIDHWGMEMWKVHVYIVARRVGRQADGHLEGGISLESSVMNLLRAASFDR